MQRVGRRSRQPGGIGRAVRDLRGCRKIPPVEVVGVAVAVVVLIVVGRLARIRPDVVLQIHMTPFSAAVDDGDDHVAVFSFDHVPGLRQTHPRQVRHGGEARVVGRRRPGRRRCGNRLYIPHNPPDVVRLGHDNMGIGGQRRRDTLRPPRPVETHDVDPPQRCRVLQERLLRRNLFQHRKRLLQGVDLLFRRDTVEGSQAALSGTVGHLDARLKLHKHHARHDIVIRPPVVPIHTVRPGGGLRHRGQSQGQAEYHPSACGKPFASKAVCHSPVQVVPVNEKRHG